MFFHAPVESERSLVQTWSLRRLLRDVRRVQLVRINCVSEMEIGWVWSFPYAKPFTSSGVKMANGTGELNMKPSEIDTSKSGKDIVIFSILRESKCSECGVELSKGSFLKMEKDKPLCLECADLDHLVFLPSGDTALTRRSRKYSMLSAVVVRFSRSRGRYERQGLLIESEALERAQQECLSDQEQRRIARERAAAAREREDQRYMEQFASAIQASARECGP
jgi:hypothetical protein